ncbi:MAG: ABC transporter permease [Culicoidibacterales bacterium]
MNENSSPDMLYNRAEIEAINKEQINFLVEYRAKFYSHQSDIKIYWSMDHSGFPLNENPMFDDTVQPNIYLGKLKMKEVLSTTNQGKSAELSNMNFDISKVLFTAGQIAGTFDTDVIIDGYSLTEEMTKNIIDSLDEYAIIMWSDDGAIKKQTAENFSKLLSAKYVKGEMRSAIEKKVLPPEAFLKRFTSETFIFILMVINFMILAIGYWLEKNKRNILIYKLMGASNRYLYFSNFLQLSLMIISAGIITLIIQFSVSYSGSEIMGKTRPLSYLVIAIINIIILLITTFLSVRKSKIIKPNMLLK